MRKNYANYLEISETSLIFASELRNNKSEKIENTVRRNKVRQAERLPTKRYSELGCVLTLGGRISIGDRTR